jgi:co-chaperonin GroES (HSP10)
MTPCNNNVFILPSWDEEEMSGRFFLPRVRHRELPNTGVVKFMPPKAKAEFKVGDRVIYNRYKQQLENVPGHKLTLTRVQVEDVAGIIIENK